MKKSQGGDHKSKDQIDTLISTADILAKQHGVSPATIKRDGADLVNVREVRKYHPRAHGEGNDLDNVVQVREVSPKRDGEGHPVTYFEK